MNLINVAHQRAVSENFTAVWTGNVRLTLDATSVVSLHVIPQMFARKISFRANLAFETSFPEAFWDVREDMILHSVLQVGSLTTEIAEESLFL